MKAIANLRKAHRALVARVFGTREEHPKLFKTQTSAMFRHSEIEALPTRKLRAPMDLDPTSPTFGKFYFTAGYDPAGNPEGLPLAPPP
jgi:hypothetical protein